MEKTKKARSGAYKPTLTEVEQFFYDQHRNNLEKPQQEQVKISYTYGDILESLKSGKRYVYLHLGVDIMTGEKSFVIRAIGTRKILIDSDVSTFGSRFKVTGNVYHEI